LSWIFPFLFVSRGLGKIITTTTQAHHSYSTSIAPIASCHRTRRILRSGEQSGEKSTPPTTTRRRESSMTKIDVNGAKWRRHPCTALAKVGGSARFTPTVSITSTHESLLVTLFQLVCDSLLGMSFWPSSRALHSRRFPAWNKQYNLTLPRVVLAVCVM
jgi:hypothetical protein